MENKKGQVVIFMIIGLIILISIILLFNLGKNENQEITKIQSSTLSRGPVQNYVESCIDDVSVDGIFYISLQGGYYEPPYPKEMLGGYQIPYYYFIDDVYLQEKDTIKQELSK